MAEPTSVLTFDDLIVEVAKYIGTAFYGADGDEAAQVPTDAHDLAECKSIVNNAIRRFIHDAPPTGWRWTRPTEALVVWPTISVTASQTVSGGAFAAGVTTVTANASVFKPSMELKTIVITGVGSFVIASYISATQVSVTGNASAASNATYSIDADGDYTLPQAFGGAHETPIAAAAGTNQETFIQWTHEGAIRQRRSIGTVESGIPQLAAVRITSITHTRRRWELMLWPEPSEVFTLEFPYDLHFDELTTGTEVHPAPYAHDETIKAACLMVAERDVYDTVGPKTEDYTRCLRQSYIIDARTAPKRLGYCGNPGRVTPNRRQWDTVEYT